MVRCKPMHKERKSTGQQRAHLCDRCAESSHREHGIPVFEERERGSIAPGKRADFVILSENPLEKDKMQIRDIRVLATIKDGDVIYRRDTL